MDEMYLENKEMTIDADNLFLNRNEGNFRMTMDWVFRTVYGSGTRASNKALVAFLNLVIGDTENPIIDVTILNPIDLKDAADLKSTVMDIKAETQDGELVDIEMQTYGYSYYPNRAVMYAGKLIVSQLDESEKYDKMKPSIVISIIEGTLFPDNDRVYNRYDIRNSEDNCLLTDLVQFHFLELGKIYGTPDPETMTGREVLAAYLKFAGKNEMRDYLNRLLEKEKEVVQMSEVLFERISEDKRARLLKDEHEMHLHNLASIKEEGRKEARAEDIEKTVRMLRRLGLSDDDITTELQLEYDLSSKEIVNYLK